MIYKKIKHPENSIFIIGGGHFGQRAARLLSKELSPEVVFVVDVDEKCLSDLDDLRINKIKDDGIDFLIGNHPSLDPDCTIVPAIPVHLAFEWLKKFIQEGYCIEKMPIPEEITGLLPNMQCTDDGSVLTSYADFLCPDDCPEPEFCTVSGERRQKPLYELMGDLKPQGFGVCVIRSRQIAPGLGGYKVSDLTETAKRTTEPGFEKWLLGTACKCHGILKAFKVEKAF
ncbi:hypothetical protein ACFL2O_10625 [Thermodesulfobacteriota bacterium]